MCIRDRTFIKPKQSSRESAVRIKLNVLKEAVAGKRVIMIDDSIVRGTTSALIVKMLRDAGAREVHVRISAPPFLHPCYFGTDIPSEDQLIAHGRTVDEVRQIIGGGQSSFIYSEQLKTLNYAISQITAGGVARAGATAASTVVMMIVPILVFVISQSNIIETMGSSGMKD